MTKKEWIDLHEIDRPISKELTDDFVEVCDDGDKNNIMIVMAKLGGVPAGVNPLDSRILKIFEIE